MIFQTPIEHENTLAKPVKLLDLAMVVTAQMFHAFFLLIWLASPTYQKRAWPGKNPYSYLRMKHLRLIAVAN